MEAYNQGRVWAEIASQMSLVKADTTSLTTVRTYEQLVSYWITVGETERANCHAGMSFARLQSHLIQMLNVFPDISYQVYRTLVKLHPHGEQGVNLSRAATFHQYVADYQSKTNFRLLYPEFNSPVKEDSLLPAGAALDSHIQMDGIDKCLLKGSWVQSMRWGLLVFGNARRPGLSCVC